MYNLKTIEHAALDKRVFLAAESAGASPPSGPRGDFGEGCDLRGIPSNMKTTEQLQTLEVGKVGLPPLFQVQKAFVCAKLVGP